MRTRKLSRSIGAAIALSMVVGAQLVAPAPARADTVRDLQWHLDALKIPEAHKITKGRGVTVAVFDSAVDPNTPDLRGQVLRGHGVGTGPADGWGRDGDAHGSAMAGVIAARGGGPMRALGIAPEVKILPIAYGGSAPDRAVAEGIRWAVDHDADIINMSFGSPGSSGPEVVAAVRYALDKDVVLVAAAGNTAKGLVNVGTPANTPGVLAVTGVGRDGSFSSGSVRGPEAALAAPMEKIMAPRPTADSGYGLDTGTSDAAAIVSGVAALIRARYPKLDAANVVNRLIRTARDKGPAGRDDQYGFGVIDPMAALTRSVPTVTTNPLLADAPAAPGAGESALPLPERTRDDRPAVSFGVTNKTGAVIQGALCLLVPVAVVVLIIVLRRRSRRRAPAPGAGRPPHPPAPGFPPPGPGAPPAAPYGQPAPHSYPPAGGPYAPPQAGPQAPFAPPGGPYAPVAPPPAGPYAAPAPGQPSGPYGPPGAVPPAPPSPPSGAPPAGPAGHHQ
ncbi:type VII secretion-associated serine protease mycosin [Micromonospora viridifaciens]|uniref:Type VII secretion-associated serine protease mycosin n=1 Tax=Micromonospora viridifaciens TaxID=1881 RepID=A0A1C4ZZY7_MICVI|nr:S8 family serine peptidase [Micromonospora viridifaciens]SCF38517.1 type VII secretion-associated serine protease mycosin [Micromonospora viridifaciens]